LNILKKGGRKVRKVRFFFSVLIVAVLSGILIGPSMASAQPIDLSVSLVIPPKHLRYINVIDPWIKMIEQRTGGKVKMTVYFSAAMAPPPETFNSIVAGVADIGEGLVYATPGKFPLTETVMLPELGLNTSLSCCKALWEVYKTTPALQKEYAGVKMLWLHVTPAVKLITRKKPVHNLADLKGLKIRVSGATAVKTGEALGFTPVSMDIGDLYLGLEKGVIDGVALPSEILVSRRLGEVTKYVTDVDLGHDAFFVVMNQKSWDKLPKDVQKVFDELTGDWAVEFTGKAWDKFDAEAVEMNKKKGIEYISLAPEELARWKKVLAPVKQKYAAELDAKGLPGTKVLSEMEKMGKK
jgi:TRAP-type C4-dicarboxylate transport system substrate-binding protein